MEIEKTEKHDKTEIKYPSHLHLEIHGNIKKKTKIFHRNKKNSKYYILWCIRMREKYYCKTIYTGYIP